MKFLWSTINVKSMDESIAFYSSLAGLHVTSRFTARPGMEIAFLGNGTDNETLLELIVDSSIGSVGFTECVSIGFAVESADTQLATVKSRGIPIESGPFTTPTGSTFFTIKDPNGMNVQFFQQKK